jgi:WD40 repeat protein
LICKWTDESQRFILEHIDVIRDSPSEIYHYALPFSPSSSWLREFYSAELSQEVKVVKGLQAEWGACSRTVSLDYFPEVLVRWKDLIASGLWSGDIIILNMIPGIHPSVLSGHTDWVASLAFSSDGTLLVSGSNDNTVKLWDIQTGGVIKTFCGHTARVRSVSISPDCNTIASESYDKTVRLWDARTGECHGVLGKHKKAFNSVGSFPPSSRPLIFASGHRVQRLDTKGRHIGPAYEGDVVAFSSDVTRFISWKGGVATVRDTDSGAFIAELRPPKGWFRCCCFSPDDKFIASAVLNTIYVWDITSPSPRLIKTFVGHTGFVTSLAFSSSLIISSSIDQSIRFWQVGAPSTAPVATASEHAASIVSVSLQANRGIAVSIDSDGVLKTWDISTGLHKESFDTPVREYDWGDAQLVNGRLIVAWYTGWNIHLWDVKKGEFLRTVDEPDPYQAQDLRISGDGSKLFLLYEEYIRAWSIRTGEAAGEVRLEGGISYLFRATVGSMIWVRSRDSRIRGWDFGRAGSSPFPVSDLPLPRHQLDFIDRPGDWNTDLSKIEDAVTGEEVFRLSGRYEKPTVARWDGRYLVAGYHSGEVLILDFDNVLRLLQ